MEVSALHSRNTSVSMVKTLAGIEMLVSPLQLANALILSKVTLGGMDTLVSALHD